MSMINDALKKAQETRPDVTVSKLEMRPVETRNAGNSDRSWLTWSTIGLGSIAALFVILGLVFLRQVITKPGEPEIVASAAAPEQPTIVTAPTEPPAAPMPMPMPAIVPAKTSTPRPKLPAPAVATNAAPVVQSESVHTPEPPPLKLQAIFWSPASPSAIISGKSVAQGGHIREFEVAVIRRDSVVLVANGETTILKPGH